MKFKINKIMGKLFNTSDDIIELIEQKFNETLLKDYGLTLKIMSTTKSKDLIKVSKATPATEFIANKNGMIQICVYEAAFDRLNDDAKEMLVEMALSNINYDVEKDKITIETNPFVQIFNMRRKYGDEILNKIELSMMIITEIENEEKERKLMEKENKKNKSL